MKNGFLILGAVGLVFLLKPNQRTKNTNIVKRDPYGFLSNNPTENLKKLTDDELKQMALITIKMEKEESPTKEEIVYYDSLVRKYNL
jgi:hypothetical protein